MNGDARSFPPLLAALLFAGLGLLVVAIFAVDLAGFGQTSAAIADTNDRIAAFDARLQRLDANRPALAPEDSASWVLAETQGVAAATVQELVGRIIGEAEGKLGEVQVIQPETTGDSAPPPAPDTPVPVSVSFQFETTHPGLRMVLTNLAAAHPLLQTDKLTIEALTRPDGTVGEMPLRVGVQVTAYWLQVKP